jgi:hypothetical protein
MRFIFFAFVLAIAIIINPGCGSGAGSPPRTPVDPTQDTTNWTVLVYMNADNDLERYAIDNLNQMEKIGSTDRVKIVVQVDRHPSYDESNGNWTNTRRYLITKDNNAFIVHSALVQDMGEMDMGDPDTLRDFIHWGQQNYPADHYCLVMWNHGSGWRSPSAKKVLTRDISFDYTDNSSIRITNLQNALSTAQPIDVVAFDACMMQMLEVAYELRNSARIMVGSEGAPPAEGYIYDRWLSNLIASPGMDARTLGTVIADQYVKSYNNVEESVIDLTKIADVARAADAFATAIIPCAAKDKHAIRVARTESQSYYDYDYKDLLDYATLVDQLLPNQTIHTAYTRLRSAISEIMVFEAHTGQQLERSHGLSVYIPESRNYTNQYGSIGFTKDFPNWAAMLQAQRE